MSKIEQEEGYEYKAQRFDSIFHLKNFLNDKGIREQDIVCILRKEHEAVDLMYKDWGNWRDDT